MHVIEAARRSSVAVAGDCTIFEASKVMESSGVGALVVLDGERIAGIVTDRDIVRRGIARGMAADGRIDSIMSTDVVTIDADADMHAAFSLFRENAVRRLPIVKDGRFVAMVTVDDLLIDLAADFADLVRPVTAEVLFGHRDSAAPVPA